MENPSYLKIMTNFLEKQNTIVDRIDPSFEPIIKEWAEHVHRQFNKGLVPLFITGSGMSMPDVPNLTEIVTMLKNNYENLKNTLESKQQANIDSLFDLWKLCENKDRSVIGRILNIFQDDKDLYPAWEELNKWLLKDKVLPARPSESHDILSKLYEEVGALCLTLNFDGLLVRRLRENGKTAFSIPDMDECEKFFLRLGISREFMEIQARGDILYLKCQGRGSYCPEMNEKPKPLWMFSPTVITEDLYEYFSKCPSCNGNRVSYLSFPGSYEKEKDMQKILGVVWKYIAFRVSCVTVIGMSGSWDPLMIAFIGDLLKEREIPLLVIDIKPEASYLVRELVLPMTVNSVSLKCSHIDFTSYFYKHIKNCPKLPEVLENLDISTSFRDEYWDNRSVIRDTSIYNKVNTPISKYEEDLLREMRNMYRLDKYAQLGLKSRWLGIKIGQSKYHHRLYHSYGVMKIASYLYDNMADDNSFKQGKEKRFLRIAALLHDIGHLPFAHLIEEIFQELNWKPAKYKASFTHSLNTARNIDEMFSNNNDLEKKLSQLEYSKDDLIKLINGEFGVGYLDAIINSAIDADKIDYIFRDTSATEKRILLSPEQFLQDIVSELSITPEKFLAFSGISAKAAAELLETRRFLYNNLYYRAGIRYLESAVRLIIVTFFVHWIKIKSEDILKINESFSDLGHYKIQCCIEKLKYLVKIIGERNSENEMELEIIRMMKNHLIEHCSLSARIKDAVNYCFEMIEEIRSEDKLKELEAKIVYYRVQDIGEITEIKLSRYHDAAKSCMLRLPGAILIDILESPKFLSIADSRKKRERSDGTNTASETIIIPMGNYRTWHPGQKADASLLDSFSGQEKKSVAVYVYPITKDESYAAHAKNLFKKLLEEEGMQEVE